MALPETSGTDSREQFTHPGTGSYRYGIRYYNCTKSGSELRRAEGLIWIVVGKLYGFQVNRTWKATLVACIRLDQPELAKLPGHVEMAIEYITIIMDVVFLGGVMAVPLGFLLVDRLHHAARIRRQSRWTPALPTVPAAEILKFS